MHSDWFNGIEILQGRRLHGEKVGYCYPSGLEKTLCTWDIYVPLVAEGSNVFIFTYCQSAELIAGTLLSCQLIIGLLDEVVRRLLTL